ncbi:hypothetical protein, partial [Pseudomonas sp. GM60]|uniref:hypothetical protein n=1 Tax=Pseudomonas sp. GM60 TaxID=1144334 RepID=UPI000517DE82
MGNLGSRKSHSIKKDLEGIEHSFFGAFHFLAFVVLVLASVRRLCRAMVFLRVYISVSAVMAAIGFALTASHLEEPQVTK